MKITQDVRDHAAKLALQKKGMDDMSALFEETGRQIQVPLKTPG